MTYEALVLRSAPITFAYVMQVLILIYISLVVVSFFVGGYVLVAIWVKKLGRNMVLALLGCFLFTPLIVALYYLIVGSITKCLYCKADIIKGATVCQWCGKDI